MKRIHTTANFLHTRELPKTAEYLKLSELEKITPSYNSVTNLATQVTSIPWFLYYNTTVNVPGLVYGSEKLTITVKHINIRPY
jgi:hypothetical protein